VAWKHYQVQQLVRQLFMWIWIIYKFFVKSLWLIPGGYKNILLKTTRVKCS
jgi:hypothetical protein